MGMDTKDKIYKWIDLESLPKYTCGNHVGEIDWRHTGGCVIKFIYGEISGEIRILKYNEHNRSLNVYVDGYTRTDYDVIYRETIAKCKLGRILRKKIIDAAPWMVQYLVDKNNALIYPPQSNQVIDTNCPVCGYCKRQMISNLYKYGFGCPHCSDGIRYPNKFMFNVLQQAGIEFKPELSKSTPGFEWIGNYRYDFYFKKNGIEYIVEMDGVFHFKDEKVIETDTVKDKLAKSHNIEVIRIDCNYKGNDRFTYIKNNILCSKLNKILNLNSINWERCNNDALNTLILKVCNYYNNIDDNIAHISDEFFLDGCTVRKYLTYGAEAGICDYNADSAIIKKNEKIKTMFGKPVSAFKNGNLICTFPSRRAASRQSKEVLGRFFDPCIIGSICNGEIAQRHGIVFTNA